MLSPVWAAKGLCLFFFWQNLTLFCYSMENLDKGGKSCYSGAYARNGIPQLGGRVVVLLVFVARKEGDS